MRYPLGIDNTIYIQGFKIMLKVNGIESKTFYYGDYFLTYDTRYFIIYPFLHIKIPG